MKVKKLSPDFFWNFLFSFPTCSWY